MNATGQLKPGISPNFGPWYYPPEIWNKPPTVAPDGQTIGRNFPQLHQIALELFDKADEQTKRTMLPWDHPEFAET